MKRLQIIVFFLSFYIMCYGGGLRVLFIGDSITDGNWGNNNKGQASSERNHWDMNHIYGSGYMYLCAVYYQSEYPEKNYSFFNRGISGNTLDDLEERWEEDVIKLQPDVLSVLIGTNDINRILQKNETFDADSWEHKYRSLIDSAYQANPNMKIVLGAPFVIRSGKLAKTSDFDMRIQLIEECGKIVERIAADYHAVFLPYQQLFDELQTDAELPVDTYWVWDGIHPTPAGHGRMAKLWLESTREWFE